MSRQPRFGTFVPQGWKLEYAGWTGAKAWERSRELAERAETLGYAHLWVYDHFETVPRREAAPCFEAWTLLGALAPLTRRVRLGQLVTCAGYRNAGLLAKQAACLDVLSGGRLILGLGGGWYQEEYASYGFAFPPVRERLRILEETAEAVKLLWTEEQSDYRGRHVRLEGAFCEPKPLQKLPPLWIGGGGERVTLAVAARHADATNWQVGLEAFVHKSRLLREHCERAGRDFEAITRTHAPDCILFDSPRERDRWLASPVGGHLRGRQTPEQWLRDNFAGTVDEVVEKVQAFVEAGAREFVLWFRDFPSDESLRRFAEEVAPRVR